MTTPIPIKFKSRYISPVSPFAPCFLDLARHRWHIQISGRFRAAFTTFVCAQSTANHTIERVEGLTAIQKAEYVRGFRIIDIESGLEYSKIGLEWVPSAVRVN